MTDPQPTDHHATDHGTPEGHTPEEPAADELGKLGTPGAGMTPATPHAADDDHGHAEPAVGPIDWTAWAYAAVGAAAGLLVVALFWVARS